MKIFWSVDFLILFTCFGYFLKKQICCFVIESCIFGFCLNPEKRLYVNQHIFQTVRTSTNLRADGLINHISSIFSSQSVQGERVRDATGRAVEVAQEVRADDHLAPVLGPSRGDALVHGVPVVVPQEDQLVHHAQVSRGVQVLPVQKSRSAIQLRQDSVFKNFLVKKPHPGFVKSTTPSNWFCSGSHLRNPVGATSSSP